MLASDIAINVRRILWHGDVKPDFEEALHQVLETTGYPEEEKADLYARTIDAGATVNTCVAELELIIKDAKQAMRRAQG